MAFSADGTSFITGSADGFLELWDPGSGSLRTDLEYQAEDKLMAHEAGCSILCIAASADGKHMASGASGGELRIWRLSTGTCLRVVARAHTQGVTAISFLKGDLQVLSGGYDGVVRLRGLKSGNILKEFHGHTSFVNAVLVSASEELMASGSADGTVRLWNLRDASDACPPLSWSKLTSRLNEGPPPPAADGGTGTPRDASVIQLLAVPGRKDLFIAVAKVGVVSI